MSAINARRFYQLAVGLILFSILVVACGGEETQSPPTFTPTFTFTPTLRSTPLPVVDTPIPLGSETRPITLGFVLAEATSRDLRSFETAFNAERDDDLTISVSAFPSMAEALAAICNGTQPTLAWVDAFTYVAAEQRCGAVPLLGVDLPQTEQRLRQFDIIYNSDVEPLPATLADIEGKSWCRLSATDALSWVYPVLAMQTASLNPLTALTDVVEVEDYPALVRAVYDGDCDMGAIPQDSLLRTVRQLERENRVDEDADDELTIDLVGVEGSPPDIGVLLDGQEPWPVIPGPVLVAPAEVVLPDAVRQVVVKTLDDLLNEEENPLSTLLAYEVIEARSAEDYADFRAWLVQANWAMSNR